MRYQNDFYLAAFIYLTVKYYAGMQFLQFTCLSCHEDTFKLHSYPTPLACRDFAVGVWQLCVFVLADIHPALFRIACDWSKNWQKIRFQYDYNCCDVYALWLHLVAATITTNKS